MTGLPGCLDEVSAEWVADVLADVLDGDCSVSVENLGDGLGQVSELGKLTIDTEAGETKIFVVKTRTNVSDMHEIGITYGMYEREVNFYEQLADELPIRTPEIHYAAWDPKTERVAIIMEFMDGWYSPDQVAGATREEVEKAIRGLAPLTAGYWNSPLRGRVDWLGDAEADYYQNISADYLTSREGFLERFAHRLPPDIERVLEQIGRSNNALLHEQTQGTFALAHWDYRVENMFFKKDDPDVAVIDWQLMMWMKPAWDFAYLCFTNLKLEDRRAWLDDLATLYLEELASLGVGDYTKDDLMADIRLCLPGISAVPVIGGSSVDSTNPRSMELLATVSERVFAGIEDMECLKRVSCLT
jgi:hypothetical protein